MPSAASDSGYAAHSLRISLADYVQLSFRRDSYSGQPSVIHITTSKGDSRLIRRPSVAIVRSPNTCNNRLPEPVIRVNSQRWRAPTSPLFVHFRADDDVTARLYARGYRLRPEFLNGGKSC